MTTHRPRHHGHRPRMRLRLANRTGWDTRDLRAWIIAAIRHEGMDPNRYSVRVEHSRKSNRDGVHGWGWLDSHSFVVRLPPPPDEPSPSVLAADVFRRASQVAIHEIGHTRGLLHRDMADWWTIDVSSWTAGLSIRPKPPKVEPARRPLQEVRAERAAAKLAEWERRAKAAANKVRTWRSKVRYYERAAAKRAASPPAEPRERKPRQPADTFTLPAALFRQSGLLDEWRQAGGNRAALADMVRQGKRRGRAGTMTVRPTVAGMRRLLIEARWHAEQSYDDSQGARDARTCAQLADKVQAWLARHDTEGAST